MKRIEIYQENSETVILFDEDKSNISKYTEKFSKVLEASKVTIIETSDSRLIIKPYKIVSIKISETKKLAAKETKIKANSKGNITNKVKKEMEKK